MHGRTQTQFRIHVFVYGCCTVSISPTLQIKGHASVTINPVVAVVDFFNLCQNL
jgi:hypothetical protein